jgi:hypothetical protein
VKRRRQPRPTLILLIIALAAFGLLIALAPLDKIDYWGIDLYTFRAGAKAMALGYTPYDEPNILRFADGATVGVIHNFAYAPYFALILRPLAWLPPAAASRVWFSLNLIFYFGSIALLIPSIGWRPSPNTFLLVLVGLILYPPLRTTLVIGQNTLFLLFWFSLSYFLLKQTRPGYSGLSLSLAFFKPHLAPLLAYYALKRQWQLLAGFVAGSLILTLPFLHYLGEWFSSGSAAYNLNTDEGGCFRLVSLTAMVDCFVWPGWPQLIVTAILVITALILVVPQFWRQQVPKNPAFDRHTALVLVLILLLLDNVRIADQMLLTLPLLVIWRDWRFFTNPWHRRLAIALMMMIYLLPYLVDSLQSYNIAFILPMWYLALTLACLGLLWLQSRIILDQENTA